MLKKQTTDKLKKQNILFEGERNFLKSKCSQSEAVGFVVIILIVIIVGVIFLGIFLRQDKIIGVEDAEIANFLGVSKGYTTDCYKDNEPNYRSLEDLTKDCYDKKSIVCTDNRDACYIVNKTYSEMIARFAPAGTFAYYRLSFFYQQSPIETEAGEEQETNGILPIIGIKIIDDITWGNQDKCSARRLGRSYINAGSGSIIIELEICRV